MSAEDRIKELDLEAVNFAKAVKGKILLGNVFQNISVESEMFCQLACVKDVHCLSYNYGTMSDMDGKSNRYRRCPIRKSPSYNNSLLSTRFEMPQPVKKFAPNTEAI